MKEEIWKPVTGYEGLYEVSNFGRVRSYYSRGRQGQTTTEPRLLKPGNVRGYLQVNLRRDGIGASGLIHRLVAEAFVGAPPSPEHQVNHLDFNKANNVPDNLEWVTQTENNRYSAAVIPRLRGEQCHSSKLTETKVREIRERHDVHGETFTVLAREFGVALQSISSIVKRRKWKHVA